MGSDGSGRRSDRKRRLVTLGAWGAGLAWSLYLVNAELEGDGGPFAVVVHTMGSIGMLYLLFLALRPYQRREALPAARDEVHGEPQHFFAADEDRSIGASRWALIMLTLALAIGGLIYRLTQTSHLHQSAAFFIGVPAILAITLALTPRAKSATGMILKGLTLALLLSGMVFFEGFVCILMASPLFYLVGAAIGVPIDRVRRKRRSQGKVYSVVGAALLLLSAEGVTPATSLDTHETVHAIETVAASAEEVRAALSARPTFDGSLPTYLKLGFPRPVRGLGRGLAVGDGRVIFFGKESPMEPMEASASRHEHHAPDPSTGGYLELEIVERGRGRVVFQPKRDATAFTHWITWGRSIVEWRALDAHTTEVIWTMHFERRLSPSWYFGPWQRYAAEKAAGYLIDTIATP